MNTKFFVDDSVRIARAIDAAVYDVSLESRQNKPCEFYFDANIVIGALFGVRDAIKSSQQVAAQEAYDQWQPVASMPSMVQIFWAAGFACRARMLWPHEIELRRKWLASKQHDPILGEAKQIFSREFTDAKIDKLKSTLAQVNDKAMQGGVTGLQLAEVLSAKDFMLALSAAFDTWGERVNFVGDRLILQLEDNVFQTIRDNRVEKIGDVIEMAYAMQREKPWSFRKAMLWLGLGPALDRNCYHDACAMNELHAICQKSSSMVRFYSTTHSVIKVASNEKWRGWFTRPEAIRFEKDFLDQGVVDDPYSCFRSSTYMALRCLIPSLSFKDRAESLPSFMQHGGLDLERLQRLVDHVRAALEVGVLDLQSDAPEHVSIRSWYRDIERSLTFGNVWSRAESKALEKLAARLVRLSEVKTVIEEEEEVVEKAMEGSLVAVASMSNKMDRWYSEVLTYIQPDEKETSIEQPIDVTKILRATGIGRWLCSELLTEKAKKALIELDKGRTLRGPTVVHEWVEIADGSKWSDDEVRLIANAFLFSRGFLSQVVGNMEEWCLDMSDMQLPICRATHSLLGCARISSVSQTGNIANHSLPGGNIDVTAGDINMHYEIACLDGWQVFYWCHAMAMRLSGSCFVRENDLPIIQSAAKGALDKIELGRNLGGSTAISGSITWGSAVLSDVLESLLGSYCGTTVYGVTEGVLPSVDCSMLADALVWNGMSTGVGDKHPLYRAAIGECRKRVKSFRERYLIDHLSVYRRYGLVDR